MNESRIARSVAIAERVAQSALSGRAFPVEDPEVIAALKREGFKLRRGFWVKTFNFDPDQHPDLDETWRAEVGNDGKLFFRSRYEGGGARGWSGALRKDMWPRALAKFAARGQQTKRKDKDLMNDTGGTSKGRDREPHFKPPREDVKERYRDRRLVPKKKDTDTNEDNKDRPVKKPSRRPQEKKKSSEVHPLDRKNKEQWLGMDIPEENYHRQVKSELHHIMESNQGISEKDFPRQDWLIAETDRLIRTSEAEEVIQRFETGGHRASYCAECIFSEIVMSK